jgi:sarcosine oxidase subunit gamma
VAEIAFAPRAPLAGVLSPGRHGRKDGAAAVTVSELPFLAAASVTLRAGQGAALSQALQGALGLASPARPGCAASGGTTLVWTGPGQWLALRQGLDPVARFGFASDLAATLGAAASVTDLCGARAVLRMAGSGVRATLAKLVPIDLHDDVFPPGAAALTVASHIGVALWRVGQEWHIACYRSFGQALAEAVLEAAAEFGCDVVAAG